jgi:hypothetical protein
VNLDPLTDFTFQQFPVCLYPGHSPTACAHIRRFDPTDAAIPLGTEHVIFPLKESPLGKFE